MNMHLNTPGQPAGLVTPDRAAIHPVMAFTPVTIGDEQLFQTPQGYLMTLDQARTAYLYDASAMEETYKLAGKLIASRLWKLDIEQAFTVLQTAKELGIPPTFALDNLVLINGKRCMQGTLMMSLVRRAGHKIDVVQFDNEGTQVKLIRRDGTTYPASFNLADAKKAGLLGKQGPWQQYPDVMMFWRAVSKVCRMGASECLGGVTYTPEDLDIHGEDLTRETLGTDAGGEGKPGWTTEQADELERLNQELKSLMSAAGEGMAYDRVAKEVGKRAQDPKKSADDTIAYLRRKVEDARGASKKESAPAKAEPKPEPDAPAAAPAQAEAAPAREEDDLTIPTMGDDAPESTADTAAPTEEDQMVARILASAATPEQAKELWNTSWKWLQSTWQADGVSNSEAGKKIAQITQDATGGRDLKDPEVKAQALAYIVRQAVKAGFKG